MVKKIDAFHKNKTWLLIELMAERKDIGSRWVFKNKLKAVGKVEKHRSCLAANGNS